MNDRFIKLALDAGLLNYVDHETPRHYFINGHAEQEDVEKFAKLIVRECLESCDAHATIDGTAQQIRDDIKKYFGVE